eukprot:TRINITY_DN19236_c0_g1_i1.p1 TRINITY_DN19236_c0_g1~~TRINITY_DN19236_c0_g1_i1.p1  ORF type:complete len:545 (+),score=236.46 TRINITY_DN19236_c0_g1_i1:84-1718(+)
MGLEFDRTWEDTWPKRIRAVFIMMAFVCLVPGTGLALALLSKTGSVLQAVGLAIFIGSLSYRIYLQWARRSYRRIPYLPTEGWTAQSWLEAQLQLFMHGTDTVLQMLLKTARAMKFETYTVVLPSFHTILVMTPAHIEHVLDKAFLKYEKGPKFHKIFEDALGDGIFNSDGDGWKQQRRTAAHLFTSWQLENRMAEVFQRRSHQVCDILREAVKTRGGEVDLQDLMYRYTFDTIYEIAFGKAVNSLGSNPKDVEFQRAFDSMQENAAYRFFNPDFWWQMKKRFNLGCEGRNNKSIDIMRDYVREVLQERRTGGELEYCATDLISLLEEQNAGNKESDGKSYSDEEIIDFVTNFTIAGRDTTASLMTWTLYELSRPEAQKHLAAVQEELARVDEVKDMHYLQAVLQEALRMWPGVPVDIKICVERDTLPCGAEVYPGDAVLYSPLLFGRNPANFVDPDTFKPSRWIAEDGTCIKYDPKGFLYPMFNAGPRTCLGRSMAMIEAKTLLSTILSEFTVKVHPEHTAFPKLTVVMMSGNGMPATVTPRS